MHEIKRVIEHRITILMFNHIVILQRILKSFIKSKFDSTRFFPVIQYIANGPFSLPGTLLARPVQFSQPKLYGAVQFGYEKYNFRPVQFLRDRPDKQNMGIGRLKSFALSVRSIPSNTNYHVSCTIS